MLFVIWFVSLSWLKPIQFRHTKFDLIASNFQFVLCFFIYLFQYILQWFNEFLRTLIFYHNNLFKIFKNNITKQNVPKTKSRKPQCKIFFKRSGHRFRPRSYPTYFIPRHIFRLVLRWSCDHGAQVQSVQESAFRVSLEVEEEAHSSFAKEAP